MSFIKAINPFYVMKVRRIRKRDERMTRDALLFSYLEYITVLLEKNLHLQAVNAGYEDGNRNFRMDKYVRKGRSCLDRWWSNYRSANGISRDPRD